MISATSSSVTVVLDGDDASDLPRNFRSTSQILPGINSTGLLSLCISGSAQPGAKGLLALKERISALSGQDSAVSVNLRHEPIAFVWGYVLCQYGPKNWAYETSTGAQITEVEASWLAQMAQQKDVEAQLIHSMNDDGTIKHSETVSKIHAKELFSWSAALTMAGFNAERYYVLDHSPPTWQQALDFRTWYQSLPTPRPWLHFNCRKGKGRTTRFMTMADIIENATRVSLNDILERQWKIGGADLRSTAGEPDWKVKLIEDGLKQLQDFYALCRQAQPKLRQEPQLHLVLRLKEAPKSEGTPS